MDTAHLQSPLHSHLCFVLFGIRLKSLLQERHPSLVQCTTTCKLGNLFPVVLGVPPANCGTRSTVGCTALGDPSPNVAPGSGLWAPSWKINLCAWFFYLFIYFLCTQRKPIQIWEETCKLYYHTTLRKYEARNHRCRLCNGHLPHHVRRLFSHG